MEVADYTALLGYLESDAYRWNAIADLGTQTVVTYSFYEPDTLPMVSGSDAGRTSYWSFDQAQRESFRTALEEFEEAAGLVFVEVEGPAMINAYGYDMYNSTVGYAYYPYVTDTYTSSSDLAIAAGNFSVGGYQYDTILHEIGHALGLEHPHEGEHVLADSVDTRDNTVMTYSPGLGTELGVFDLQALEHIYGSADAFDGWNISGGGENAVRIRATSSADTILAADVDTIILSRGGADTAQGRNGDDRIFGGGGKDVLSGGGGNDLIKGGRGADQLFGEAGNDRIFGDRGRDILDGGDGNDKVIGGGGKDVLKGGGGDDKIKGGKGADQLFGGDGDDRLIGNRGRDVLTGGDGDDVMTGGGGADVFVFTTEDYYDSNTITDFKSGVDHIDVSEIGLNNIGDLQITTTDSGTTVNYYSWFEIELTGFTGTLTTDDILFS
ncbi:Hemolysin, plasmid [Phaeobacter sp. CECT 5382]|uniref:reprolysin-like metallopeptidase n=1 Tax=Phaeobacter sp. CECT 5382 TaxID=1712645 RepID=UPI0006D9C022|nr:hypothetical protein [Phaeobacter sp. CECT 5382]CUH86660.1 Hemolysin, plasmid [Phaeobacter sp. CECT 5382]